MQAYIRHNFVLRLNSPAEENIGKEHKMCVKKNSKNSKPIRNLRSNCLSIYPSIYLLKYIHACLYSYVHKGSISVSV